MATEEPQHLPLEAKTADSSTVEKMEVDEPATKTTNGVAATAEANTTPATNGDIQKPTQASVDEAKTSQNNEAFATNSSLSDSKPQESSSDPAPTADTEMTEASRAPNEEVKESKIEAHDTPQADTSSSETLEKAEKADAESTTPSNEATESKPAPKEQDVISDGAAPDAIVDTMDVDASAERPDTASTGENVATTQKTETDAPVTSPGPESSQPADLSTLEINTTQVEENIAPTQEDVPMTESATTPPKIVREREEDDSEEPAAKRAKTVDQDEAKAESPVVASNDETSRPALQANSEALGDAIPDTQLITPFQNKRTREVLGNVKKTKNGGHFRKSVRDLWPGLWNDYSAKIDNPVDISLMETKLREDQYANYGEFKADVNLLHQNTILFNGPEHDVTHAALSVKEYILSKIPDIIQTKEPVRPEKGKAHPTRHTEPRAATQPRRESVTQPPLVSPKQKTELSSAAAPASSTTQAFAVPPSGIPQIRRDSTRDDNDRPKRPIHPPKNRDPEYTSKASRKKKLEPHQRFFDMVLEEIKRPKHAAFNQWFLTPVDPVALNIPNYFKLIKKPMDLATMTEKNIDGQYKTLKDVARDMALIVANSEVFNGPDNDITNQARQLEQLLKTQLAGKDKWMERHFPVVTPSVNASAASPGRSTAESDESEGDGEEEESDAILGLQQRLNEEQDKLNQLLNSKKPDITMVEVQQSMVTILQRKLVEERTKSLSEKKPKKKKATSAKSKSKAVGSSSVNHNRKSSASINTSKKPASHSKKPLPPKKRAIGALEKAVIAEGINELDGNTLTKAVEIIKRDTGQNENDDGEMELDIDSLTVDALAKLYDLINKAHPHIRHNLAKKPEYSSVVNTEPEPKSKSGLAKGAKHKPMNKHEQERKIEQLRELKAQLQRHGSGSQEPMPETEGQAAAESSESSDSEEE